MATTVDRVSLDGITTVRVIARSGSVTVSVVDLAGVMEVSGGPSMTRDTEGALAVLSAHGGSKSVDLRVPPGTNMVIGTGSGRIRLTGRLGLVRASAESGSIEVDFAASVDARTSSGGVKVAYCEGPCRIQTRAGQARLSRCDDRAEVATESGQVTVGETHGDLRVRTAHGSVDVKAALPVNVAVQTMSGRVRIAFPHDTHPTTYFRSRTGRMSSSLTEGNDCKVAVETLSGGLEVVSA